MTVLMAKSRHLLSLDDEEVQELELEEEEDWTALCVNDDAHWRTRKGKKHWTSGVILR